MGLEEVKNELKEKASQEKEKIISSARKEAREIIARAQEKAKESEERELEDTKKIIDSIERKEITTTELDIKKQQLNIKRESINAVFDDALKSLAKDKKNTKFLHALLAKAEKSMDVSKVHARSKDKSEFKDYKFENADIQGGFIAESADGSIMMDYSYDTIISDLKGKILTDVAQMLFENAKK